MLRPFHPHAESTEAREIDALLQQETFFFMKDDQSPFILVLSLFEHDDLDNRQKRVFRRKCAMKDPGGKQEEVYYLLASEGSLRWCTDLATLTRAHTNNTLVDSRFDAVIHFQV